MNICVLIPVYNEAKTLGAIVKSLKDKGLDVIVVDDGSTDDSSRIAKENGAFVMRHQNKNGKGYSLQRGFQYILKEGYDGIIMMDGDGQHAVEDIGQFIEYAQTHQKGMLNGNRMVNSQNMPWLRFLTNRIMSLMISFVCRQSVPDTQCGYRYISREILENIDLACKEYEIETEMLIKASKKGYTIDSVGVQTIYKDEESHIHPFKDTIRFFAYYLKELFTFRN